MTMDTPTLVVMSNMTAALIFMGILVYLIRSGKWPKKRSPSKDDSDNQDH